MADRKAKGVSTKETKRTAAEETHRLAFQEEELRRTRMAAKTVRLKAEREQAEVVRRRSLELPGPGSSTA